MGNFIGIVGDSGTGKSTSVFPNPNADILGLNPKETVYINVSSKPLPFRGWKQVYNPEISVKNGGNYIAISNSKIIADAIQYISDNRKDITNVIIDDSQYTMAFELMNRVSETGYNKFTEIGKQFNTLRDVVSKARLDLNVYCLWHPEYDNEGGMKMKTVGKMVDAYLTPEGLFTVVLYTKVSKDLATNKMQYQFVTNNDGKYPAKSPIGMFEELYIKNDLGIVDKEIRDFNS